MDFLTSNSHVCGKSDKHSNEYKREGEKTMHAMIVITVFYILILVSKKEK